MIRAGDNVIDVPDPVGGWSVRLAEPGEVGSGALYGRQGTALGDETECGSVLVDVSPTPVYGGGSGVWMRVLGRLVSDDPVRQAWKPRSLAEWSEEFNERAAILEFNGGFSREEAERRALIIVGPYTRQMDRENRSNPRHVPTIENRGKPVAAYITGCSCGNWTPSSDASGDPDDQWAQHVALAEGSKR